MNYYLCNWSRWRLLICWWY